MIDPVMRYFRDQAIVRATTVAVTNVKQVALQSDPMRYMTTVWNDPTIDLTLWLYDSPNPATGSIHIPPGMGPVVLNEDILGDLMGLTMFAVSATAGPTNVTFYSCSYEPVKYLEMLDYARQRIAQFRPL